MGQAYTPGLTVKERTTVEKVRRLPLEGEVTVEVGDEVEADTVVARTHLPGGVYPVNAASVLRVEPRDLGACMLKKAGDPVERGEVLAWSRGFFGFFKTPLESPVKGTIETLSPVTGQIIFRRPPVPKDVKAYIDGRVVEVYPGEGVKIRTTAAFIQGIFGIGREASGRIAMKTARPDGVLDEAAVGPGDRGKIVVAGAALTAEVFQKAEAEGVAGVIAGSIRYGGLKRILHHEIGVAITGSEPLLTTLVVTEGFGSLPVSENTFRLLETYAGRKASINGATQIRAGVIRPELIIPLGKEEGAGAARGGGGEIVLEVGSLVRIIRAPHFGLIGRVVELPSEPRTLESETAARVVVVRSEEGRRVEAPRANVEIIDQ